MIDTPTGLALTTGDVRNARNLAVAAGSMLTVDKDLSPSVLRNAGPIEAWLLAAPDLTDLTARCRAVRRHMDNLTAMSDGDRRHLAAEDAGGFLFNVELLYQFLIGSPAA